MGRALAGRTEEGLSFGEEKVQLGEVTFGGFSELVAGEWMGGRSGCDERGGCTACGEVAATRDGVLEDALFEVRGGASGSAFDEPSVNCSFGLGIGEEEMLDDLLNAPLVGARVWAELGLGGIESADGGGDVVLELVEGRVHWTQHHVTSCHGHCATGCARNRCYWSSARAFFAALAFSPSGSSLR